MVSTSSYLLNTTFPCGGKRTFVPAQSYRIELQFNFLTANFEDLGFGEELPMPPRGKVSECVVIAIYVKNSLRSVPTCSTQSVLRFVGLRRSSLAFSR